ncbi:hypothetical protein ACIP4U_30190 [Streptomyces caelestis]|uniref:hypothetical protein n=1 Tax=Streptomyces caelestis TaxID=36816 RepID=UPI0037FF6479
MEDPCGRRPTWSGNELLRWGLLAPDAKTGGKKACTTEVDGQQAITLTREQAGVTDRWHVATEGQPYILKSSRSGGALPGETTLDYNKPVDAKAPPAADVVDVNKGRRGGPCGG